MRSGVIIHIVVKIAHAKDYLGLNGRWVRMASFKGFRPNGSLGRAVDQLPIILKRRKRELESQQVQNKEIGRQQDNLCQELFMQFYQEQKRYFLDHDKWVLVIPFPRMGWKQRQEVWKLLYICNNQSRYDWRVVVGNFPYIRSHAVLRLEVQEFLNEQELQNM